jgi:undecaprenyl-diphosphatase
MASQHLIWPEYAMMIQILGELIVLWWAIFLVLLWLYGIYKKDILFKLTALRIFFLIVLVFSIYAIINLGLPQWRPGAMELSGADALIPHPTDNSFPSGHALFSAAMLVGIWKYFRNGWIISITVLFALISTTARVIGGVHYPGDILGGFFFGWIGAVFLARIVENKKFQDTVFPIILRIASWIKL